MLDTNPVSRPQASRHEDLQAFQTLQIAQLPVGGVDTGVRVEASSTAGQLVPGLSIACVLTLAGIARLGVYQRSRP